MNNLSKIRIGDYIDIITDYHSNGSYKSLKNNVELLYEENYALMARTLNFEQNNFNDNLIFVNKYAYDHLEKSKVYPNDIFMNKIANPGNVYLMPDLKKPVTCGMNLFLIRFNKKVNQKYMYYCMKYNEEYIKSFAHGTTTKTITKDEVKNIELYIHNLSEQNIIADYLFSITTKINNNNEIIRQLIDLNKNLFNKMFFQFKDTKTKMVNELNYEFPENWDSMYLKDVIELQRGVSYKSNNLFENGLPMINLASFDINRNYKSSELKYIKNLNVDGKECKYGDMLIACTDLTRNADIIGSPIFVPKNINKGTFSMDLSKVIIKDKKINTTYLYMWLRTDFYHNYIKGFATGTNVMHLNTDGILNYVIVIPPIELQEKYEKTIENNLHRIENIMIENEELNKLMDFSLNIIMCGKAKIKEVE